MREPNPTEPASPIALSPNFEVFSAESSEPLFSNNESIDDHDCPARIREITSCTIDHTIMRA